MFPIWKINVAIAATTALCAIALLFYNFLAILISFPLWP